MINIFDDDGDFGVECENCECLVCVKNDDAKCQNCSSCNGDKGKLCSDGIITEDKLRESLIK